MGGIACSAGRLIVIGLALLMPGCATLAPENCARFQEERKTTNYSTRYERSEADSRQPASRYKPLPAGSLAVALLYRVRMNSAETRPCRHVRIEKELYLQRATGSGFTLEEVREVFADDGTLIATKSENVTRQVPASGQYVASVPFPIPEKAPPGRYRIATRLVLRASGGQPIVLARASANFTVLPKR